MNLNQYIMVPKSGCSQLPQASHQTVLLVSSKSFNFFTKYETSAQVFHVIH